MDPRERILLEKLTSPDALLPPDAAEAADIRREAEINAVLSGMRIKAGMEPVRERILAGAVQQASTNREKNMNPIIRLLSGRPWPVRLAIMAGGLLAITLAAQLPAGTSYASSAGRALVFDLGVASSESEQAAKREQWELKSKELLDSFAAIRESAHHVALMSSPTADNLLSLSGVIFVMDDEQTEQARNAQGRARDRFEAYSSPESIKVRVSELQKEIQLLSGGMDERSRAELERARKELVEAKLLLSEVMDKREGRMHEAAEQIELRLREIQKQRGDLEESDEIRVVLEKIEQERARIVELKPDMEVLQLEIERLVSGEQQKAMAEHAGALDEAEIARLVEEGLAPLRDLDNIIIELDGGTLELELDEALRGLDSLEDIREVVVKELRLQDVALQQLHEELQSVDLQALENELSTLEVQLQEIVPQELLAELEKLDSGELDSAMQLELSEIKLDLERELKMLEELQLDNVKVELQRLEELKDIVIELDLPEGELLELTMLEDLRRKESAGKLSFRFEDHLFSFPASTPAKKMAATVNEWLKENGYDCEVRVEVTKDDNGRPRTARAVVKE